MNDKNVVSRNGQRRPPLSIWDLPASLLTSVHRFRQRKPKGPRDRAHFAAILAFIYRNRFVTASQVQRRFSKFLRSDRTARRHMAEMQESLRYLDLVPTPSPLWPKVYAVSRRGLQKLAHSFQQKQQPWEPSVKDRSRRNGFSIHHVVHELFISEFLLSVWESAQARHDVELLTIQRRSLAKHPGFELLAVASTRLIPDAMYLLRQRERGLICTFLEIDTGSMSLKQVATKLRRYSEWGVSGEGQTFLVDLHRQHGAANPRPVFRIAVVCGGTVNSNEQGRLEAIVRIASRLSPTIRSSVWLTTTCALRELGKNTGLFQRIWSRAPGKGTMTNDRCSFLNQDIL